MRFVTLLLRPLAARPGRSALALWVVLLALLWGTATAQAPAVLQVGNAPSYTLEPALTLLADPGRSLTLAQILQPARQQQFRPLPQPGQTTNLGLTRAAIWLRLTVQVPPDTGTDTDAYGIAHEHAHWRLEVAQPTLDRVQLFSPTPHGGYREQVSGDLLRFGDRPLPHFNHLFPLTLPPGGRYTFYLRVVSEGNLSLPVRLWQAPAMADHNHSSYALLGLYFGLLLGLVLYNLLLFLSLREPLYLHYIGFAIAMGITQLGLTGLGAEFLWPDAPRWGHLSVLLCPAIAAVCALQFTRAFLETAHQPRLDRLLRIQAALYGLLFLAMLVLPYQICAWLLNLGGIAFALTLLAICAYCLVQGQRNAGYFMAAWGVLLASILVKALFNLGWLPAHPLVVHALLVGSALEMLVLAFSLADRIRTSRLETLQARSGEQKVIAALQASERELEARVLERTQALQHANQQLQENEQRLALLAHHDNLTGLANRQLLDDRLAVAMAHAQRNRQGFALLVLDLDGFKHINDHYGHAAGDTVLQSVALRLTSTVRGVDTVARTGGDEFVLILDAVDSASTVLAIARKIRDALTVPIALDKERSVQIGASVGLAIYPVDGTNAEQLIAAADQAMYQHKKG